MTWMADLNVTTINPDTNLVSFRFPRGRLTPVVGLRQLGQQFAILILKDPGSDKVAPNLGGGIRQSIGIANSVSDVKGIAINAIVNAEDQMADAQRTSGSNRSKSETMSAASLVSVEPLFDSDGFFHGAHIVATVSSADKRSAEVPIQVLGG